MTFSLKDASGGWWAAAEILQGRYSPPEINVNDAAFSRCNVAKTTLEHATNQLYVYACVFAKAYLVLQRHHVKGRH